MDERNKDESWISCKKMKEMYPAGGYFVVGSIGDGVTGSLGWDGSRTIHEAPKNHILYHIIGYEKANSRDGYIAVYKSRKMLVTFTTAILLLLISMVSYGVWNLWQQGSDFLDANAKDYQPKSEIPVNNDPEKIAIPGYDDIRMPTGDISHIALWNPDGNPCYFKFSVILSEQDELLYQSKFVEPGKAVTEQKLSKKLKAGVYPITIRIDSYQLNNPEISMNGGEVKTNLIVVTPGE